MWAQNETFGSAQRMMARGRGCAGVGANSSAASWFHEAHKIFLALGLQDKAFVAKRQELECRAKQDKKQPESFTVKRSDGQYVSVSVPGR